MENIVQVKHLKKYYKDVKAVDDISFSVQKGELFGFLGVNGAGKSTTINMLCTLLAPTKGEAKIAGMQLGKDNERIKHHIGVVYQNNCLDRLLTVQENLLSRGALYEKEKGKLRQNLSRVSEILELSDVQNRTYGKLSGGQKRRCEIACALMHAPDVLFLDEPTTGLDPATRKSVWKSIHNLQKELNMTVFLTTHYMEEAAKANHIAIMDQGHLIQYGTPFSLKEEFAKDKLNLIPITEKKEAVIMKLKNKGISYKDREGRISVKVESSMEAMPILNDVQDLLTGFEVIQGTMDDVFLNATGGVKENE